MKKLLFLLAFIPTFLFGQTPPIYNVLGAGNNANGRSLIGLSLISLKGSSSGTVAVNGPAVITTYTFTLPPDDGTSGQFLQTDGNGVATWQTVSTGLTIGSTAIASGTALKLLYDNAGILGEHGIIGDANGNLTLGVNAGYVSTIVGATAIGVGALNANTTGYDITAVGWTALNHNTTGFHNTAIGAEALYTNTTGGNNTATGEEALYFNTTGSVNNAFGRNALLHNTTGNYNCAFGNDAMTANTTGSENSAFGLNCLQAVTTADENSSFGGNSGYSITTGIRNVFMGRNAGYGLVDGNYNVGIGYNVMQNGGSALGHGGGCVAIGNSALQANTSGNYNVAIGTGAGNGNTTGEYNVYLGYAAAYNQTTLSNKLLIGNQLYANATDELNYSMFNGTFAGANNTKAVNLTLNLSSFFKVNGATAQLYTAHSFTATESYNPAVKTPMVVNTNTATIASATLDLTDVTSTAVDGQLFSFSTAGIITSFTLSGATFYGGLTAATISPDLPIEYMYSTTLTAWIRKQ